MTPTTEENLKKAIQQKDYAVASELTYSLAQSSWETKKTKDAINFLDQSLTYSKKANVPELSIKPAFLLGLIKFENREYRDAFAAFEKSSALSLKAGQNDLAFESLMMQGRSADAAKNYKKEIEAIDQALAISIKDKSVPHQLEAYKQLEQAYLKSGNKPKSEEYKNHYDALVLLEQQQAEAETKTRQLETKVVQQKKVSDQKLREQQQLVNAQKVLVAEQQEKLHDVEGELKNAEEANERRQLEIDLLSKESELANLRIQEQGSRLEHEALFRNSILVVVGLLSVLIGVVAVNYRRQAKAKAKIESQNKNIRSSINYAKRIQEAMLPKKDVQETYLKDSFIYFNPRDVVSGDFYWLSPLTEGGEDLAFAAMDCTGHGVPGAFMSMIGINSLNTILRRGITEPNEIIETLHKEIRTALKQEVTGNNDGMDAALCVYRPATKILEFAGAKNPLVYIQKGELHQIKGDIHSIGGSKAKHNLYFKKHEIRITEPTMVYLFSDGYRDQFGGPENQKFMSKRFSKLLLEIHELPLEEQSKRLSLAFDEWKGKREQTDDVLVMGVRLQ